MPFNLYYVYVFLYLYIASFNNGEETVVYIVSRESIEVVFAKSWLGENVAITYVITLDYRRHS